MFRSYTIPVSGRAEGACTYSDRLYPGCVLLTSIDLVMYGTK